LLDENRVQFTHSRNPSPRQTNARNRYIPTLICTRKRTHTAQDAPWCSMTSTQASKVHLDKLPVHLRAKYFPPSSKSDRFEHGKPVKGRNEPAAIGGVAWVVHQLHSDVSFKALTEIVWKNTVELFKLVELEPSQEKSTGVVVEVEADSHVEPQQTQ
jgi:hypothetical protein